MFPNKNQDYLQIKIENKKESNENSDTNINNNNNNISNSTKQLINFKEKFISPMLSKLNSEEKNSYLEIMLDELVLYKYEKSEIISKKLKKEKENLSLSKNLLYNYLEKNLIELSYINDKEKRKEKINKIYEWYKSKLKLEKDIKTITYKTYKNKNEIDDKEYLLQKQMKLEKLNTIELNKIHRNFELINKKMLDEFKRKKLSKPFCALKKAISSQIFSSQDNNDFNTLLPSTSFSGNEKLLYSKKEMEKGKDFSENSFLTPVNKGINFCYSFLSPNYDLNDIFIENQINKEKNKIVAYKRNQEELNKKIKEFSLFRAKFKANSNHKLEKKNLINLYVNNNNLSSFLLNKYKIKEKEMEKEKEKNENKELINESKISGAKIEDNKRKFSTNLFLNKNFESEKISSNKLEEENNSPEIINIESNESNSVSLTERERSYSLNLKKNKSSFIPKISLFKLNKEDNNEQNTDEFSKNFIKKFKMSLVKKLSIRKKRRTKTKKQSSNALSKFINLKLFSGNNNKIQINQIKNMENDSKKIKLTDNTSIKQYAIKFPKDKSNSDLLNKNKKEKNSDAISNIISNEALNKEKLTYGQLCKINSNPPMIDYDSDIKQRTKMILLNKEINKETLSKIEKRNKLDKFKNRYNLFKNNLLSMRQAMSFDKKKEYENLIDKMRLNNNNNIVDNEFYDESKNSLIEIEYNKKDPLFDYRFKRANEEKKNYSLLNALVNPNDSSNYSRYYLPRNGSMLLSKDKTKKIFKKFLF